MSCEDLPIVRFDECNPLILPSEITHLYTASINAAPFVDWRSEAEWQGRVSNSTVGTDFIRKLTVIGDMPLPTPTEKEISAGRMAEVKTARVINFEIDECTDENYQFILRTETVTGVSCRLWVQTKAGVRYGSNDGIIGKLKIRPLLTRGTSEIEKYIGTFKWNSLESPGRHDQPNFRERNLITDDEEDILTNDDELIFV